MVETNDRKGYNYSLSHPYICETLSEQRLLGNHTTDISLGADEYGIEIEWFFSKQEQGGRSHEY